MRNWNYEEATERIYMACYVAQELGLEVSLSQVSDLVDEWDSHKENKFVKRR